MVSAEISLYHLASDEGRGEDAVGDDRVAHKAIGANGRVGDRQVSDGADGTGNEVSLRKAESNEGHQRLELRHGERRSERGLSKKGEEEKRRSPLVDEVTDRGSSVYMSIRA